MSLHAPPKPAVLDQLQRQRKRSTISALGITLLVLLLVGLLMAFLFIKPLIIPIPVIVTYQSSVVEELKVAEKRFSHALQRKPSAPPSAAAKAIAVQTASPLAIPVPELDVPEPSLVFGSGDDFGDGWGAGDGDGDGSGKGNGRGGLFGSSSGQGLVGTFYDLKQDRQGQPTDMKIQADEAGGAFLPFHVTAPVNVIYDKVLSRFVSSGMNEAVLSDYFKAPENLVLTQLCIPATPAQGAPQAFDLDSTVQGRRWLVIYRGVVSPGESGRFRFAGFGDDVLVVRFNNKIVLDASFAPPSRTSQSRTYSHSNIPHGWKTIAGETIEVRGGSSYPMELLIGERPGGEYSGYLLIEKIGQSYQKDPAGGPILPLFKLASGEPPPAGSAVPPLAPDTSWSVWKSVR